MSLVQIDCDPLPLTSPTPTIPLPTPPLFSQSCLLHEGSISKDEPDNYTANPRRWI